MARNELKWMLVDNHSFFNILFGDTFNKMIVDHELTPITTPFYSFTDDSIIPRRKITIVVEMGDPPQITLHFMEFMIVDYRSAYHEC